jgi:hypothetical protein
MAKINDEIRLFIVKRLACYDTPQEVADAVKEEFDIEVDRNQTSLYDPTKAKGKKLGKKWADIFHETRKKFLEDLSELPLANPAVRVAELSKLYQNAKTRKNAVLAAAHLEQIAKEVGGVYSNKIRLTGGDKGDSPVQVVAQTTSRLEVLRKKVKK